ncbi:hypothetical protein Golax_011641 [Gossypium laxum]|uniref:Uncharacterized protein n=1 Tax=Gossypium laxum TaxID=34288 RepID=A0A7J8ZL28_9ROSI|nr:hypothetical protein [Gossypium laxum]
MGLPVDTVKSRLKDKNGPCISWSNIRDAMGKANGDRHLSLFAFAVYGLIVFPKALGYVPLIGIWGAISYSSLIALSQYGYDQYIPATAGLNRVEAMVQDLGFWKKLKEIRIKWGQTLSFAIRNLFQPFPLRNVNPVVPKKKQNLCVSAIQGKKEDLR